MSQKPSLPRMLNASNLRYPRAPEFPERIILADLHRPTPESLLLAAATILHSTTQIIVPEAKGALDEKRTQYLVRYNWRDSTEQNELQLYATSIAAPLAHGVMRATVEDVEFCVDDMALRMQVKDATDVPLDEFDQHFHELFTAVASELPPQFGEGGVVDLRHIKHSN